MTPIAQPWIGGQWTPVAGGAVAESIDPSTGQVLGLFADAGVADAEAAIAAARRAFDQSDWAYAPRLRAAHGSGSAHRRCSRTRTTYTCNPARTWWRRPAGSAR